MFSVVDKRWKNWLCEVGIKWLVLAQDRYNFRRWLALYSSPAQLRAEVEMV